MNPLLNSSFPSNYSPSDPRTAASEEFSRIFIEQQNSKISKEEAFGRILKGVVAHAKIFSWNEIADFISHAAKKSDNALSQEQMRQVLKTFHEITRSKFSNESVEQDDEDWRTACYRMHQSLGIDVSNDKWDQASKEEIAALVEKESAPSLSYAAFNFTALMLQPSVSFQEFFSYKGDLHLHAALKCQDASKKILLMNLIYDKQDVVLNLTAQHWRCIRSILSSNHITLENSLESLLLAHEFCEISPAHHSICVKIFISKLHATKALKYKEFHSSVTVYSQKRGVFERCPLLARFSRISPRDIASLLWARSFECRNRNSNAPVKFDAEISKVWRTCSQMILEAGMTDKNQKALSVNLTIYILSDIIHNVSEPFKLQKNALDFLSAHLTPNPNYSIKFFLKCLFFRVSIFFGRHNLGYKDGYSDFLESYSEILTKCSPVISSKDQCDLKEFNSWLLTIRTVTKNILAAIAKGKPPRRQQRPRMPEEVPPCRHLENNAVQDLDLARKVISSFDICIEILTRHFRPETALDEIPKKSRKYKVMLAFMLMRSTQLDIKKALLEYTRVHFSQLQNYTGLALKTYFDFLTNETSLDEVVKFALDVDGAVKCSKIFQDTLQILIKRVATTTPLTDLALIYFLELAGKRESSCFKDEAFLKMLEKIMKQSGIFKDFVNRFAGNRTFSKKLAISGPLCDWREADNDRYGDIIDYYTHDLNSAMEWFVDRCPERIRPTPDHRLEFWINAALNALKQVKEYIERNKTKECDRLYHQVLVSSKRFPLLEIQAELFCLIKFHYSKLSDDRRKKLDQQILEEGNIKLCERLDGQFLSFLHDTSIMRIHSAAKKKDCLSGSADGTVTAAVFPSVAIQPLSLTPCQKTKTTSSAPPTLTLPSINTLNSQDNLADYSPRIPLPSSSPSAGRFPLVQKSGKQQKLPR